MKVLKFTKNHRFHENRRFSRKANFTENVTAVKSLIKLVLLFMKLWSMFNSFSVTCTGNSLLLQPTRHHLQSMD